jgi:ribonuclease HII
MAELTKLQQEGLKRVLQSSSKYLIGIDEVGYGSWAGPVLVAGAVCRKGWAHPEVRDSKKVTPSKRKKLLSTVLVPPAIIHRVIITASVKVIDNKGVFKARNDAIVQTARALLAAYPDSTIVLDGDWQPDDEIRGNHKVIVFPKADDLVPIVSAASIIAKVRRDEMMMDLAKKYPGYGFETNVGYGTQVHKLALQEKGPCELHRYGYKPVSKASRRRRAAGRLGEACHSRKIVTTEPMPSRTR